MMLPRKEANSAKRMQGSFGGLFALCTCAHDLLYKRRNYGESIDTNKNTL